MKLKGKFEKEVINVGLSAEVPITYRGPEQKYTLADALSRTQHVTSHIRYEKRTLDFELEITSADLVQRPERLRCYRLISAMPEGALEEVEETLRDVYQHYLALEEAAKRPNLLPPPRAAKATITERSKT